MVRLTWVALVLVAMSTVLVLEDGLLVDLSQRWVLVARLGRGYGSGSQARRSTCRRSAGEREFTTGVAVRRQLAARPRTRTPTYPTLRSVKLLPVTPAPVAGAMPLPTVDPEDRGSANLE